MGYRVKPLPGTLRRGFKVQWCTYKNATRVANDIPEREWGRLGFRISMSLAEARLHRDKLNAQQKLHWVEDRRVKIRDRLRAEALVLTGYFNPIDTQDFELEVLPREFESEQIQSGKIRSHWRKAQQIMMEVKIPPDLWFDNRRVFYEHFGSKKMSPSYIKKVLRLMNMWGRFICRREGKYFDLIPFPAGLQKEKIADHYHSKGKTSESEAITPPMLERRRSLLGEPLYRWIFISLWFGLRPSEVDALKDPRARFHRVETKNDTRILWVYQPKLGSIPEKKRWKYIPVLLPEQELALSYIAQGDFRRVSHPRYLKAWFGAQVTSYGGRKGFEHLMGEKGYRLEDISLWLGHQSIERTWRNYKDKQRVRIPERQEEPEALPNASAVKVLKQMQSLLAELEEKRAPASSRV